MAVIVYSHDEWLKRLCWSKKLRRKYFKNRVRYSHDYYLMQIGSHRLPIICNDRRCRRITGTRNGHRRAHIVSSTSGRYGLVKSQQTNYTKYRPTYLHKAYYNIINFMLTARITHSHRQSTNIAIRPRSTNMFDLLLLHAVCHRSGATKKSQAKQYAMC